MKNIKETHITIASIDPALLLGFSLEQGLRHSNEGIILNYKPHI